MRHLAVADQGIPIGDGVDIMGGACTPKVGTFWKVCMSKTRESGPVRGVYATTHPPMNLPMLRSYKKCMCIFLLTSNPC